MCLTIWINSERKGALQNKVSIDVCCFVLHCVALHCVVLLCIALSCFALIWLCRGGYDLVVACLRLGCMLVVSWLYLLCVLVMSWFCCSLVFVVSWLCLGCALVVSWMCIGCFLGVSWVCLGCVFIVYWFWGLYQRFCIWPWKPISHLVPRSRFSKVLSIWHIISPTAETWQCIVPAVYFFISQARHQLGSSFTRTDFERHNKTQPRHFQDTTKAQSRHNQHTTKTQPIHNQYTMKTQPRHTQDTPKKHQKIAENQKQHKGNH